MPQNIVLPPDDLDARDVASVRPEDLDVPIPRHQFPLGVAASLGLVLRARTRLLRVPSVVQMLGNWCGQDISPPSYHSARLWLMRLGLHELNRPKPHADDWMWIFDHTMQLGSHKCLIVVGVRQSAWDADDRILQHEDVELIDLVPVIGSNGDVVFRQLKAAAKRTGPPRAMSLTSMPNLLVITSCTGEKSAQHRRQLTLTDFKKGRDHVKKREAELAELVVEMVPSVEMVRFVNSGTEATMSALRLARAYTGRHKILARYRSYHGATHGSIALTGDYRRLAVEPTMPGGVHFLDPFCYRCPFGQKQESCKRECISHLDEVIRYEGADKIAAIIMEGVVGSNGIIVPPDDYWPRVREICDKHGILLISDEVMSGWGKHYLHTVP